MSSNSFQVVLYRFDEPLLDKLDRLHLPLVRLYSGRVVATDARAAAARVWIDQVGVHRWGRLDQVNAPDSIRGAQVDQTMVESWLADSTLLPDSIAYLLDNGVEAWLVSVEYMTEETSE